MTPSVVIIIAKQNNRGIIAQDKKFVNMVVHDVSHLIHMAILSDKKWTFVYSEGHSMLMNETFFRAFTNHPNIPGIVDEIMYINKHGNQTCYMPWSEIMKVREQGKMFFDQAYRIQFQKEIKRCAKRFAFFWNEYKKIDFSKITNKKLLQVFKKYIECLEPMLAYYQVSGGRSYPLLEEYVKKKMGKILEVDELEENYAMVLTSTVPDLLETEEMALLKLSDSKNLTDKKLLGHASNFAYAYLSTYENTEILKSLGQRIGELKNKHGNYKNYVTELRQRKNNVFKKQNEIMTKLTDDKDLVDLANFLRVQGKLRFDYKEWFFGAEYKFLNIFNEIARRINLPVEKYMAIYREQDTERFLLEDKKLTAAERKIREKIFIFLQIDGGKFFYTGQEAKNIEQQAFATQINKTTEVKGIIANPGVVRGKAHVILPKSFTYLQKAMHKFKKGEILITTMTQPNLLLIMKKAAAIVTNQGGVTSHAAVLSREIGIPCVVGTLTATDLFKTGDLIEVDATKGVVKRV